MISRIAWLAALLAIGVVTTFVQIDRQAEVTPPLASWVPQPLRAHAQAQLAARAVEGDDTAMALDEARLLVRRRPIPAEHLTLLAIAQIKAGAAEQAEATIQIAGQRGWREPLAQEAVLRLALAAGDKPEAARRYTALFLRASTPDALLRELGPSVLGGENGPGRRVVIDIVSATDRWHDIFLRRGTQVIPPAAFAEIIVTAMARDTRFDCDSLDQAHTGLVQRDADAADAVMAAFENQCPR